MRLTLCGLGLTGGIRRIGVFLKYFCTYGNDVTCERFEMGDMFCLYYLTVRLGIYPLGVSGFLGEREST